MASPNGKVSQTPLRRLQQERPGDSPTALATESPSRQLLSELSMQTVEYTNQLYSKLDKEALEREQAYLEALSAASFEHERVRRSAQRAQELVQLGIEKQKREEEAAELRALDKERQEKVEQEIAQRRQALEESKRLAEKEKIAAEAKAAAEEAEQHRRAQKAKDDEEAAKQAAAQRQLREAEARRRSQQDQEPVNQPNGTTSREHTSSKQPSNQATKPSSVATPPNVSAAPGLVQGQASRQAEHERYLNLHIALKEHRKHIMTLSKSDQNLKNRIGDMRREIRKSVGQLTADLEARRIPLAKVRTVLKEALQSQHPSVDIAPFILSQPLPQIEASQRQVSALLLYLLNIFSKSVIAQFIDEAGSDSKTADPIGIVAISIFAHNEFRWQGISLIDMLIAKFHVTCPILFGIYGSERTEAGRARLGWKRDPDTGTWVTEQRHSERMTGLGSGFAALSLRNFQNSTSRNPYPPANFWRAIASIVNTPPQQITPTHCTVLKAMIEHHVGRFISFYGAAAVVVVKKAVVELPKQAPPSTAANVLATLSSTLGRDLNLNL